MCIVLSRLFQSFVWLNDARGIGIIPDVPKHRALDNIVIDGNSMSTKRRNARTYEINTNDNTFDSPVGVYRWLSATSLIQINEAEVVGGHYCNCLRNK
jgi:hypothetical protein